MATYTYDLSTVIGQIRLNIPDTDVSGGADTAIFSDEELQVFYDLGGGSSVYLAVALALETLANSQALRAKLFQLGNWQEDNRTSPKELRAQAQAFRDRDAEVPAFATSGVAWTDSIAEEMELRDNVDPWDGTDL